MRDVALWAANIAIPGGGLVLSGSIVEGVSLGVSCATLTALAIVMTWVAPESYHPMARVLLWGCAIAIFAACQIRLSAALRRSESDGGRREALLSADRAMKAGQSAEACTALREAQRSRPDDLLVAVRLAEALHAAGRAEEAAVTWRRVRELDHHHLYRDRSLGSR